MQKTNGAARQWLRRPWLRSPGVAVSECTFGPCVALRVLHPFVPCSCVAFHPDSLAAGEKS